MNSTKTIFALLLLAAVAMAMSGCGETQRRVQAPAPNPAASRSVTAVSPSLAVSDDIARACQLSIPNAERAPKFVVDESELLPADRDILQKLAACVTTGPLKGKQLDLIGRADPRGTIEYNVALGARRAATVATYLGALGVASTTVHQTSRGELDATGHDESTWQIDRRVDIRIAL
jgi:peptidoglycan-associated lipoprotein